MEIRRCMKCMHALQPNEIRCPACGQEYGKAETESFALRPGTILDGKYMVGEMLGQGGFGITYIGFDLMLEQKVAIKEYFPMSSGLVSRENQTTVVWSSAMLRKTGTEKGFDSFLKEARKMAKLGDIPGVVGVKSLFIQNETAYIVMDFVEGETLQKKLMREGPMKFDSCVNMLKPVMEALALVHKQGIIHRDISPDNIMVRRDGKLVLLDLGAAKDLQLQQEDGTVQSSQLVAKHGFSPVEQYRTGGNIGPWTDVYAMAATIYYCCTGQIPPVSLDRLFSDTLARDPQLTANQFAVLAAGMTVQPEKRPQNMDAFMKLLAKLQPLADIPGLTKPKPPKWLIPAVAAGIGLLTLLIVVGTLGKKPPEPVAARETEAQTESAPQLQNTYSMLRPENLSDVPTEERADQPFWGQIKYKRSEVQTVTFLNGLNNVPRSAWDVSEAGDGSVMAWMNGGALYVASDGHIAPNSDASWMFAHFTNLKTVDFGDRFDTSNVTDMHCMFYNCTSLETLDISGFNTTQVTHMNYMFDTCSNVEKLDVSGFETSNVTDMMSMFGGCSSVEVLDVSEFDTSNVTNISWMFSGCMALKELDVSSFDTANVTDMSSMFNKCGNVKKLDVSGFKTSNVTNMQTMFSNCTSLEEIDVSGFDTSNVTDMYGMFNSCSSVAYLDIGGFDTAKVTNMKGMFSDCSSVVSLDVIGFNTSNVMDMACMFRRCGSMERLDVSGFNTSNVNDMSEMFENCGSIVTLDVSGFNTANVSDMATMFCGCKCVEVLDVSGFNTANVTNMYGMFSDCDNLATLDVSGFNTANVTDMGYMFRNCGRVESLDVSRFDTKNVTNMSAMFGNCASLEELDVSGFITPNVTDMGFMFRGCSGIKVLDVSGFNTEKVTNMKAMFGVCSSVTELDVTGFDTANVTDMDSMFHTCSNLKTLNVSGFDTTRVTEMQNMFSGCEKLTNFTCKDERITQEYNNR